MVDSDLWNTLPSYDGYEDEYEPEIPLDIEIRAQCEAERLCADRCFWRKFRHNCKHGGCRQVLYQSALADILAKHDSVSIEKNGLSVKVTYGPAKYY